MLMLVAAPYFIDDLYMGKATMKWQDECDVTRSSFNTTWCVRK